MGNSANYVVIRNNEATAYYDQWAALGCLNDFAYGPEEACQSLSQMDVEDGLMDWAFAEGGYLIDFDQKRAIVFGYPGEEIFDPDSTDEIPEPSPLMQAFERSPRDYLQFIAPNWQGWLLQFDTRGVDAFAAYLRSRNITSISTEPDSHPPNYEMFEYQA